MIFNKTYNFRSKLSALEIRQRLLNKRFKVKDLDFEVYDKENKMKVIPDAEHIEGVRTLPITHIDLKGSENGETKVRIFSKPRRIDAGGPYMVVIFCVCGIIAAGYLLWQNWNSGLFPSIATMGGAILILLFLFFRMQMGYYKYVRNIKNYIQGTLS